MDNYNAADPDSGTLCVHKKGCNTVRESVSDAVRHQFVVLFYSSLRKLTQGMITGMGFPSRVTKHSKIECDNSFSAL